MSNQYTKIPYSKEEIDNIIKDYQNGVSLFKLRVIYKRKKENIKSLLMENNIFIEGRDKLKKDFNEEIIEEILNYYQKGMGSEKISKIYGVSKVPILRILKENNVLQKGYSDGKKIILTEEQKHKIKRLYLVENKTSPYISKELNLNLHFIEKYIYSSDFKRTQGESISLRQTGKKHTKERIENMKLIQQKFASSGNRKQKGGICKFFNVGGLDCQGTYEKFYIEKLIKEKKDLPKKGLTISTPYGVYTSDFSNKNNLIEIKSDYTYDILIGKKISRFTKKIELNQYKKISWVNENIKSVEIFVVDKRNNELIKKEIV
jgi:hypothetical protein